MKLTLLPGTFAVCKVSSPAEFDWHGDFAFAAKTDDELSLVCRTDTLPRDATTVERGWRLFKVTGPLDFDMVGVLADLTALLADAGIALSAVSTFNTDYLLVKEARAQSAADALRRGGHIVV